MQSNKTDSHLAVWMRIADDVSSAANCYSDELPRSAAADQLQRIGRCLEMIERVKQDHAAEPDPNEAARVSDVTDSTEVGTEQRFGRWRILERRGCGGHGLVFRAFDPARRSDVALKLPRLRTLASDELRRRFAREVAAAAALHHPHLVSVLETGQLGTTQYIVSEYCSGPTLAEWLRAGNSLTPHQAASLVATLADAVAYLHRQDVLHRDLKPSNVLLFPTDAAKESSENFGYIAKLTDFGLIKHVQAETGETRTGAVLGTPRYMAPEQLAGHGGHAQPATDVFGLGVMLYELLTGRTPNLPESDSTSVVASLSYPDEVPGPLRQICDHCLHTSISRRCTTAAAMRDNLRRFLDGRALPAATPSRKRKPQTARLLTLGLGAGCALLVVLASKPFLGPARQAIESRPMLALPRNPIHSSSTFTPGLLLLVEDWEQQQVGDLSDELLQWRGPAGRGLDSPHVHEIVNLRGNKVLRIDAAKSRSGKVFLGSTPETPIIPFMGGSTVSLKFDARLKRQVLGRLLCSLVESPKAGSGYRLVISDIERSVTLVREEEGEPSVIAATDPGTFDPGDDFRSYELRATFAESGLHLQVLVDDYRLFSVVDPDPRVQKSTTTRVQFQVEPRSGINPTGTTVLLDNIQVAAG